jgi:hypothetical protein
MMTTSCFRAQIKNEQQFEKSEGKQVPLGKKMLYDQDRVEAVRLYEVRLSRYPEPPNDHLGCIVVYLLF